MKLSILLAGSILTSAIVGNVYAQTCGAQPSCSSLGYTYTGSTSDCVNTPMKCPFNTSYFNCTKKADVVNTVVPNYNRGKNLTIGVTHTITEDGWIYTGGAKISGQGENGKPKWYINGYRIGTLIGNTDENSAYYPVVKGDRVLQDRKGIVNYLTFFPNRKN